MNLEVTTFYADGRVEKENVELDIEPIKLTPEEVAIFCSCGNPSGMTQHFCEDGECEDMHKHHYHCADCAGITQIG